MSIRLYTAMYEDVYDPKTLLGQQRNDYIRKKDLLEVPLALGRF
jgi:hypothetical protein